MNCCVMLKSAPTSSFTPAYQKLLFVLQKKWANRHRNHTASFMLAQKLLHLQNEAATAEEMRSTSYYKTCIDALL